MEAYGKRITLRNGKPHYESVGVSKYKSRYGLAHPEDHKGVNRHMERTTFQVVDMKTGEVLGDLVYFSIGPGWFDRLFLGLLPVEFNPWICGNEAPPGKGSYSRGKKKYLYGGSDVVMATIKPKRTDEGERK